MSTCIICGGDIVGDGYTIPRHCESVECPCDLEADAPPFTCDDLLRVISDLMVYLPDTQCLPDGIEEAVTDMWVRHIQDRDE